MEKEIWVGHAELRYAPIAENSFGQKGKGTFTSWACWAMDDLSFKAKVTDACQQHGLFIAGFENVMAYKEAVQAGLVGDELEALVEHSSQDEEFCVFETLHGYKSDN
jgi:hypothetical protein